MPEPQTQAQTPATNNGAPAAVSNAAGTAPEWLRSAPTEYHSDPSLTRYKDFPTFLRSFKGLEQQIGKSVRIPGEDATDEERAAFAAKLGRPEAPDKYEFANPEGWDSARYPIDENLVKGWRQAAFEMGIPAKQAGQIYQWYLNNAKTALDAQTGESERSVAQNKEQLQKEYGYDFDRQSGLANRAIREFATDHPEMAKFMEDPANFNNPTFFKFFAHLGSMMSESTAYPSEAGAPQADTVQAAIEKLDVHMASGSKYFAGDPEANNEVPRLFQVLAAAGVEYKSPKERMRSQTTERRAV